MHLKHLWWTITHQRHNAVDNNKAALQHPPNNEFQVKQSNQIDQPQIHNICNNETTSCSNLHSAECYQQHFSLLVPLPPAQPVQNNFAIRNNKCTPLSTTTDLISSSSTVLYDSCSQLTYSTIDRSSLSYEVTKL